MFGGWADDLSTFLIGDHSTTRTIWTFATILVAVTNHGPGQSYQQWFEEVQPLQLGCDSDDSSLLSPYLTQTFFWMNIWYQLLRIESLCIDLQPSHITYLVFRQTWTPRWQPKWEPKHQNKKQTTHENKEHGWWVPQSMSSNSDVSNIFQIWFPGSSSF